MRKVEARYNAAVECLVYKEDVEFNVEIVKWDGKEIKISDKATGKSANEVYEMMVEKHNLFDDDECYVTEAEEIEVVRI